jgi:hypothetical protein
VPDAPDAPDTSDGPGPLAGLRERWEAALSGLAQREGLHGTVAGRLNRLLLDAGRLTPAEANRRLGLVLSTAGDPGRAGAYLEGFLAGGALLLLHDPELLEVVDAWLTGAGGRAFDDLLPLVRRAFASFSAAERRQIGQQVTALGDAGARGHRPADSDIDEARAALVLPTLRLLLGTDR